MVIAITWDASLCLDRQVYTTKWQKDCFAQVFQRILALRWGFFWRIRVLRYFHKIGHAICNLFHSEAHGEEKPLLKCQFPWFIGMRERQQRCIFHDSPLKMSGLWFSFNFIIIAWNNNALKSVCIVFAAVSFPVTIFSCHCCTFSLSTFPPLKLFILQRN